MIRDSNLTFAEHLGRGTNSATDQMCLLYPILGNYKLDHKVGTMLYKTHIRHTPNPCLSSFDRLIFLLPRRADSSTTSNSGIRRRPERIFEKHSSGKPSKRLSMAATPWWWPPRKHPNQCVPINNIRRLTLFSVYDFRHLTVKYIQAEESKLSKATTPENQQKDFPRGNEAG